MTENAAANDKKSAVIIVIGIASVMWLLVCVWLFWAAEPCDADQVGWYARKVGCLATNEMGDSLAGAFAPLAFLWLIAAVFLQRNELAAQRRDLRETREVAVQQVNEARKNVELITEQTKFLRSQRADDQIRAMVSLAIRQYRQVQESFSLSEGDVVEGTDEKDIYGTFTLKLPDQINEFEFLKDANMQVTWGYLHSQAMLSHAGYVLYGGWNSIETYREILEEIINHSADASPSVGAELTRAAVDRTVSHITKLRDILRDHGQASGGIFADEVPGVEEKYAKQD